jgi:hypothetical protein
MLQARSSGQSIEMRRSADYLGVLGRSMSGQNPLPAVASRRRWGLRMSEQPTGSTSTQRFYSVKMLDRSNSGPQTPLVMDVALILKLKL